MPERMTAKKVKISDIVNGEWVQQEGMDPSYVISKSGEKVSRARILATVMNKFISEDKNFGSVTMDDGSDTMRAKCFKDLEPIENAEKGSLVDVIGKVREYNGEIYVMPEVVRKVDDPNMLLLRELEIKKHRKDVEKQKGREDDGQGSGAIRPAGSEKDELRRKVLEIIESGKEGMEYSKVIEQSGEPEEKIEPVINDLLSEGICYEPMPGKIKKI
ncbi:MAG: hypothetical protein DRO99_02470 [Candidatus Aenigmatarchaeota archaeon]|nr:MAG: hypothetical protein DRO99_02470 [Candidatus Aenigmarchaeota archaeon]